MPIAKVQMPDGRIAKFEVAEGTSPAEVEQFASQQFGNAPAAEKPKSEYGRVAQEALGVAKGASDPFVGASQMIMRGLNALGVVSDEALKTHENYYNNLEKQYQEATPEGSGIGRAIGNVATTAPLAFIPGAQAAGLGTRALAGAATGAASGALTPVTDLEPGGTGFLEEKAKQIGLGAAGGAIAPAVGSAISRAVNPKTTQAIKLLESGAKIAPQQEAELGRALDVAKLLKEDIRLTPGQIAGGALQRLEEGATSIPLAGDVIKGAQRRGLEDFNRSVVNRALAPIGESVAKDEPVGYAMVDKAHQMLSQNYDDLLSKLKPLKVDPQFDNEMSNLLQMSTSLHPDYAKKFEGIMQNDVFRKFTPAQTMSSTTMKDIDSELGKKVRKLGRSDNGDDQEIADALKEAQRIIRSAVERQNPEYGGELRKANMGWAELMRVENAAGRQGAKGGIFTPNQYESAVNQMGGKSARARGKAFGQDYATAAESVLAKTVPDSGTPFRMMAGAGLGLASLLEPTAAATMLGTAGAYTGLGQKFLQDLMIKRPDMAPEIAKHLQLISQGAALGAPALLQGQKQ